MSETNTLAKLSPTDLLGFILHLLHVIAGAEGHDWLWWRTDGEYAPVTFFANCNDCFWWATSDCERITPENIDILGQAIIDCEQADPVFGTIYAAELFAARVRKMRPQGATYTPNNKFMWPLYDACGPKRDTDKEAFGNPTPHPEDRKETATDAK